MRLRITGLRVAVCGWVVAALLLASSLPASAAAPGQCGEHRRGELVELLREGGRVLVFRHAFKGDQGTTSVWRAVERCVAKNISDRDRRNRLTQLGRKQARELGQALKARGISVGTALTSTYCRTLETALLAFGRATQRAELDERSASDGPLLMDFLTQLLPQGEVLPPGTNLAIVTHSTNLIRDLGQENPREAEAFVLDMRCPEGDRFLGRVKKKDW